MTVWMLRAALALLTLAVAPASAETLSLRTPEGTRDIRVIPPQGPPRGPMPLLLLLHGRFGTGEQMLRLAGIGPTAGLIVAAPDGYRRSWASGRGVTAADHAGLDDVAFLRQVVAAIAAQHPVDPARIFAAGLSNGGFMAARLACEAADLVAGIAIVGATTGQATAEACHPGRPVAVLLIHGTADPLVGVDGTGPRAVGRILGAAETARFWADRQGCAAATPPRALPHAGQPDGTVAYRIDFTPCRDGARVTFIEVRGGGHVWPGRDMRLPERIIGPASNAVDASAEVLAFFGLPHD